MKKFFTETPIQNIIFFLIFLFHVAFCINAFYVFGFNLDYSLISSYHPIIILIYTVIWFFVFKENILASYLYIAISIISLALPFITKNYTITNTFGGAMAHLDIIFATLILIDYRRFFKGK